jgi:hypothetical protein
MKGFPVSLLTFSPCILLGDVIHDARAATNVLGDALDFQYVLDFILLLILVCFVLGFHALISLYICSCMLARTKFLLIFSLVVILQQLSSSSLLSF